MFTLTSSVSIDNTQISILYNSVDTLVVQECGSFYQVCLGLFFFLMWKSSEYTPQRRCDRISVTD